MTISPFQARLAFGAFLTIGALTALNILYLQDQSLTSAVARAKADKLKQRAEAERSRRLALEPAAIPEPKAQPVAPARKFAAAEPAVTERVGRFSPTAGQLDRPAPQATNALPATNAPQAARIMPSPQPAPQPAPSADPEQRFPEVVKSVQQLLGQKGYEPGTPDGVAGIVTRAAVMAYEHDNGLPLSGEPSEQVLRHLQGLGAAKDARGLGRPKSSGQAEQVIRSVQQSLAALGYFAAKVDGRNGEDTVRAIREFEMDAGLVPTGRVSAPLLLKLARSNSTAKTAGR